MVTLADLAGIPLPKQALGGETLRPLLLTAEGLEVEVSCHSLTIQAAIVNLQHQQATLVLSCNYRNTL